MEAPFPPLIPAPRAGGLSASRAFEGRDALLQLSNALHQGQDADYGAPRGRVIVILVLTALDSQPQRHGNRAVLRLGKWCLGAQSGLDGLAGGGTSPPYAKPVGHGTHVTLCAMCVPCPSHQIPPDPGSSRSYHARARFLSRSVAPTSCRSAIATR